MSEFAGMTPAGQIRHELRRIRPELPPLPAEAPRRQHYEYMRDTYLITDEVLAASCGSPHGRSDRSGQGGGEPRSRRSGLLHAPGPRPHLLRRRQGHHAPLQEDPRRQGRPPPQRARRRTGRIDPDAGWHVEGGNPKQVWGTKFALLSTRLPKEGSSSASSTSKATMNLPSGTRVLSSVNFVPQTSFGLPPSRASRHRCRCDLCPPEPLRRRALPPRVLL